MRKTTTVPIRSRSIRHVMAMPFQVLGLSETVREVCRVLRACFQQIDRHSEAVAIKAETLTRSYATAANVVNVANVANVGNGEVRVPGKAGSAELESTLVDVQGF